MFLKKGAQVKIISGKDKGKTGEILEINRRLNKIKIKSISMIKRHTKPTQNSAGGIIEKEAMINISNIAFYDEKKQKPSKIGFKILEDGRKVRVSKLTSEVIDK